MSLQIATLLRAVYFGGNWTAVNFKNVLEDVTWEEATTRIGPLNTIVTLVYHTSYYITAVGKVLEGGSLDAKDKYSFDHPAIASEEDWVSLREGVYKNAEYFATLLEKFPEEHLSATFVEGKYGTYYRNFHGIIEHLHYHLGQIVLIKKLIRENFNGKK